MRQKVQVWVYGWHADVQEYRVLLLQTTPGRGQFWQPVTGGVDPEESVDAAAAREAREETGLRFKAAPESLEYTFRFEKSGIHFEEFCYSVRVDCSSAADLSVTLDPNEHSAYAWVPFKSAMSRLKHVSNQEVLALLHRKRMTMRG